MFATYAIVPPQSARNKDYYLAKGLPQPALRVTAEDDKGVTLNGMKMLASGAAYAHEVLIGNVMPLAPDQKKESITCVIPLNLPGLSLWSREPFNREDDRVRPAAHHAFRRIRLHAGVQGREGAVGKGHRA